MKQTQVTQEAYNVGIYCRISREDGNGESVSIQSQKLMLTDYVTAQNWRIVDYFCDDGVSGSTFDRPELNRMIEEIEAGKINLVICKDLSRLGRNYIAAGQFCEMYFPTKGVRFLALNDNFDTDDDTNSDIAPFKHVLNDLYLRDISRKIKSARKAKAKTGHFTGSFAPLGYRKDPDNHNHLVIDEETAPLVRRIFDLYISGLGTLKIATILTREKVLIPSAVIHKQNPGAYANIFDEKDESMLCRWNAEKVRDVLINRTYIGCVSSQTQYSVSMKTQKRKARKPEDWIVVENCHEPIIDRATWDIVQNALETKRREMNEKNRSYGFVNEFAGVIKCTDCGANMGHRVKTYEGKRKTTISRHYACKTYVSSIQRPCTFHRIRHEVLYELVLRSIQKHAALSQSDKTAMAKQLLTAGNHQQAFEISQAKKEIRASEKRLKDLERLIMKLYEEYVSERVSGDNYSMMMEKYQGEQVELKQKIAKLNAVLAKNDETAQNADEFLKLIEQHSDVTELTPAIVNQLITKIAIHEAQTVDGVKTQQIDIYWRFVGNVNLVH